MTSLAEMVVRNTVPASFNVDTNYSSLPSGALAWWHFNDGTGTWADDAAAEDVDIQVVSTQWSNMNTELKPSAYEHRYTYDKVGNRTVKYEFFVTNSVGSGLKWTCTYNGLNQLTQQNKYSADGLTLDRKWLYTYDADGNVTTKEKQTSAGVKEEKWVYSWNPRNQMTLAEKFTGTNDTYAGKVAYRYCLSCDSVLSERIEYSPTVSTTITSWKRYEYDGLNLLRMDGRYDTAGGALDDNDPWRTLEVSTHKPGSIGALIGKRVYTHTNNDATPDSTNDYTYTYDAVGNVVAVYNANSTGRGNELYYFTQDAFGNELAPSIFAGSSWTTARTAGITEHQTGKWIDPFTGLYFFHARWYDSGVGRFVGRDPMKKVGGAVYSLAMGNPLLHVDPSGRCPGCSGVSTHGPSNIVKMPGWEPWVCSAVIGDPIDIMPPYPDPGGSPDADRNQRGNCLDLDSYLFEDTPNYPKGKVWGKGRDDRKKHCFSCCMIASCVDSILPCAGQIGAAVAQFYREISTGGWYDRPIDSAVDCFGCFKGMVNAAPPAITWTMGPLGIRQHCIERCGGDYTKDPILVN